MGQVAELKPPAVATGTDAPVRQINSEVLRQLGYELNRLFDQYKSDRRLTELKWMRNLRQYLGQYDPEIEQEIGKNRSRAYPRITRVKCISVLSRIMNLMYPGNELNWELQATPCPQMSPDDVRTAVQELVKAREADGAGTEISDDIIQAAVKRLADKRAKTLSKLIEDQLQELGGDQTRDVIALDRQVADSGIKYGVGYLEGPYVRKETSYSWVASETGYEPTEITVYKPQFDVMSVWDTYIDMGSRCIPGDGYFIRKVLGKKDFRKLADRNDFMADQIKNYIRQNPQGNYKALEYETELRAMGTRAHINDQLKTAIKGNKFEVIVWKGPVAAQQLKELGADVPEKYISDDVDAEVWMVDGQVIKADINPWRKMGIDDVKTLHAFVFDEDDTSPIGNGLPNVMRDSAMSIAAATRMLLDNASVTCGPNLEVNRMLLEPGQDITNIEPYKVWVRDDDNAATAQFPAVRKVDIDGHIPELQGIIDMFMRFADVETFVGPATGGDMEKAPSEPMRTAAGASMLRGDAALPFKDIVRNFDTYKQSMILSLVHFNKKFNPQLAPEGDYDVIARGATSLIAKEVRGMQLDMLSQTLTPEERDWIDERKFVEQKFAVRDMQSMMLPEEEALRKRQAREASMGQMNELQAQQLQAEVRKTLAEAFKNITQGQKNAASADATTSNAALDIMIAGMDQESGPEGQSKKDS